MLYTSITLILLILFVVFIKQRVYNHPTSTLFYKIGEVGEILVFDKFDICAKLYKDRRVEFIKNDLSMCHLIKIKDVSDRFEEKYNELLNEKN